LQSNYPGRRDYHIRDGIDAYLASSYLAWVRDRMLSGEPLLECRICHRQEALGLMSKRQHEIKVWGFVDRVKDPVCVDLKLGNQCNLMCVMCDPGSSSRIAAEYQELGWDVHPPFEVGQMGIPTKDVLPQDFSWPEDPAIWQMLTERLPGLKKIKFTGGEPLCSRHLVRLLEYAAEHGYNRGLKIQIISNGTVLNERIRRIAREFDLDLVVSLEGVGPVNDFIRYPSRWEDITRSLAALREDGIGYRINATCSLLNLLDLPDLIEFNHSIGGPRMTIIPVQSPEILDPTIAPGCLAAAAQRKLDLWKEGTATPDAAFYYDRLGSILRGARYDERLFRRFAAYLRELCRHRKLPLRDFLPGLADLIEALD
jgi:MoaA/NifB/PqqE/SkfB family radical SAM enzyme